MGLFWIEATRRRANSRVGAPPERGGGDVSNNTV